MSQPSRIKGTGIKPPRIKPRLIALGMGLVGALGSGPAHAEERPGAVSPAASPAGAPAAAGDDGHNPFAAGVSYAQARCVRIYGAGIGREAGYASGVVVSAQGHVLTAQGIYLAGDSVRVAFRDGRQFEAKVLRRSAALQAALLKVDQATPEFFDLTQAASPKPGDWVITLSNAFKIADRGEELSVNLGVVALRSELDARHRTQDVDYAGDLLLFDAITSNPGAPGGAVVDHRGRLAGVIGKLIQSTSTNTRLNYAVPADQLRGFVLGKDEPAATPQTSTQTRPKPAQRVSLGLRLFTLSGKKAPAYVESVPPGSPAKEAGIRRDDLIMAIAGRAVRSVRDFEEAEAELPGDQDVDVILKRGQQVLAVRVKLSAKGAEAQP